MRTFTIQVPAVWNALLALTAKEAAEKMIRRERPHKPVAPDDVRVWENDRRTAPSEEDSLSCQAVLCRFFDVGVYELQVGLQLSWHPLGQVRKLPYAYDTTDEFGDPARIVIEVVEDWARRDSNPHLIR